MDFLDRLLKDLRAVALLGDEAVALAGAIGAGPVLFLEIEVERINEGELRVARLGKILFKGRSITKR